MKIMISAVDRTLEADVDPRFGRCRYFIIADPETLEFEVIDNAAASGGGAGIAAAQAIAGKGVAAVLTGNCGPNAHQVLSSAGIKVMTGVSGTVKDVIDGYKKGKYAATPEAGVPDHFGLGAGGGFGGGGRGMGRGRRQAT